MKEKTNIVNLLRSPEIVLVDGVKCVQKIQLSVLCYESATAAGLTGYEALKAALNLLLEVEASLFESVIAIYDSRAGAFTSRDNDPDWREDLPRKIVESPRVNEFPNEL